MRLLPALSLLALGAAGACKSAADPADHDHNHRYTTMVTIADDRLLPAAEVAIPAFATVLWRNNTASPVEVAVEKALCNACDTVLGFAAVDGGVQSAPIAPGAVATLCFHEPGEFAFTVAGAGAPRRGTVHVGGGR